MLIRVVLAALAILSSGCSLIPDRIETPIDMVGEVSRPEFTGWYIDSCDGRLIKTPPNCVQIGGEVYKVLLLGARTPESTAAHEIIIAFPAHALKPNYRARVHVHLVKAPDAFEHETGIAYMAREWSGA